MEVLEIPPEVRLVVLPCHRSETLSSAAMLGAPFIGGGLATTKLRPHLVPNVPIGAVLNRRLSMEYTITAAFLLAVVTGSFAVVILSGYEIAQLVASAL